MPLVLDKIDTKTTGFFRFKKLKDHYLLTNDVGQYCRLDQKVFMNFINGKISLIDQNTCRALQDKGFIRNSIDFNTIAQKYAVKNNFLKFGPSLHIIVVTLRCDHRCLYCQAGSGNLSERGLDMSIDTARQTVERIFESPSPMITIEFQGGEPLVNWDTVKFIITYSQQLRKKTDKQLLLSLVSNLTFMTNDKLHFLLDNNVSICTSLDGPRWLHNKNRNVHSKNSGYDNTIKWIKTIRKAINNNRSYKFKSNALTTITRYSLPFYKEIVDEFVDLGFEGIFLRTINPFGLKKSIWNRLSFSVDEFLAFYKNALDYIIELNLNGTRIYEKKTKIFLSKMLTGKDPDFLDIRSPCGAGLGQLAYNYDGKIYTCDEARMLSRQGDDMFCLGDVFNSSYRQIIDHKTVKALCIASCLDGLPGCSSCVYKPYCGVCPIHNYVMEKDIFGTGPKNELCKIRAGILDYLFARLFEDNQKVNELFYDWSTSLMR